MEIDEVPYRIPFYFASVFCVSRIVYDILLLNGNINRLFLMVIKICNIIRPDAVSAQSAFLMCKSAFLM